ncbi:class I SAM-dependent methyltransferase [Hyalangium rubrum]|uniref:Class I SAM-dependent methyltransferase n=1 Tax=Hyalangium rubrum TaxID=3103134 RepID=A0ABU5H384_9BACT|nr:class I SAM-dependent methyltransferase [Hyalangium sp. s54d21]MDY7227232.1 class I SAM-dependent methyltransferase [Hyalangium sp. s54d21]
MTLARDTFLHILDRHISDSSLQLLVNDKPHTLGAGEGPPAVTLRIHRDRFFNRVLSQGNLGMGEAYVDGDFSVEQGELHEFLTLLLRNRIDQKVRGDPRTVLRVLRVQLGNMLSGAQWRYVQHHYDLGDELFESFLDDTMTYSCGYALTPEDSLEALQYNKLDRLCRKLELKPQEHLLDIGCGFGGLLIHAARHYGVTGVGITNSRRHCERGNENIARAGLSDRIRIELRDHASIDGRFDKVVSVGMLEHLPRKEYGRYFSRIAKVLAPRGMGLVHAIGTSAPSNTHDPFIQRYIFPGSGQVKLSEVATHLERQRLAIRDVENIVRHYHYTAKHWLTRFQQNQHRLAPERYGPEFRRLWEYYLHCCVAAPLASDGTVYQVLFMKDYAAPMPLHRV